MSCFPDLTLAPRDIILELGQSNGAARLGDNFSLSIPVFTDVDIYNVDITTGIDVMTYSVNTGESTTSNGDQGNYGMGTIAAGLKDSCSVFKYTIGGTGLDQAAGAFSGTWSTDLTGNLYDTFKSEWNNYVTLLESNGYVPNIIAVVWVQGERDATDLTWANNYQANFESFVQGVNTHIGMSPKWFTVSLSTSIRQSTYQYFNVVNTAMINVASANPKMTIINTDLCTLPDDVHYDSQCIIDKGIEIFNLL